MDMDVDNIEAANIFTSESKPAILVRGVRKQFGKDVKVLEDLNMTVLKGTIYGLLGASGCGKTTLLRSMLGCTKIQNGSISILGKPPGLAPVKSIGYMPQNMALVEELTIKNVLQQQGWIFQMTNTEIEERIELCKKLLNLPPLNRFIKDLSGGEQRRVSLAVVLIQDPELLILDEPTVGLDPVLRKSLWDYFTKIVKEENKTVLITTHYIEEARQADAIAMIRNGNLIVEGEPQALMSQFNFNSLEKLFASLSAQQEESALNTSISVQQDRHLNTEELKILSQGETVETKSLAQKICFTNGGHAKALMSKNILRYIRNPGTYFLILIMPIIQMSSIFIAIGSIPSDWKIGIVNQELGKYKNCEEFVTGNKSTGGHLNELGICVFKGLGCKFTTILQEVIQNQVYFDSIETALEAVREKQIQQILFIPHNYSTALSEVYDYYSSEDYDFTDIIFYKDDAANPVHTFIQRAIYDEYLKFAEELANDCKWNKRSFKSPIVFNKPVYGKANLTYTDFLLPGWMTMNVLIIPMALAISTIMGEKNGGIWERTMISGVRPTEILVFHLIPLTFVSIIETAECFLIAYKIFGFECQGNIINVAILLYSQSFLGVAIGILLSATSKDELEAMAKSIGIVFSTFVVNGMVWPIEGQPTYLQYFSIAMPSTIPIESINNIVFKGWDILNYNVYKGYLVSFGYSCLFIVISILKMEFESK